MQIYANKKVAILKFEAWNTADRKLAILGRAPAWRAIFNALGHSGDWNDRFSFGNPASHLSVKQYLKSVQTEQAQARVSPKQATPVFFDELKKIVFHLRSLLLSRSISPSKPYIYAHDLAFFSLDFFSGNRAYDLSRIKTIDVLKHPDGSSLLFHQRMCKTLRE